MDRLEATQKCLSDWENGGNAECYKLVSDPHANPYDPECNVALTTVYHALISSTLCSRTGKNALSVDSLIAFIRSVVDRLPSSSNGSEKSPNAVAFGEILIDILWSIDCELEDILADAKNTGTLTDQGALTAATVAQAVKAKENAELDKGSMVAIVRRLLATGILDTDVCRERLDLGLVASVGLVTDKAAFERKEIRTRTGLFYKQNKFNLLREQSEGYSKLTTELTSSLGPPNSPSTGHPAESLGAIEARARPTWERALGLIGYFDLDPNRALDIILDVFSVHLASHHTFFLSLLSASPWGGRTRRNVKPEDMAVEPNPERYRGKTLSEVLKIAEEEAGARMDDIDGGHTRVLAQVLGFKFTYYQSSEVAETAPKNLYLMAAILIREGFLSLEDLYSHIGPTDDKMDDLHKAYLANIETRIAGAKVSQLAMAAPLESGGSSNPKPRAAAVPETKVEEVKEAPNQKLGLLNALLSVGALRPAVSMLSKFPWMVDAYPEIADLMLRILKHSIAPLYATLPSPLDKLTSFAKPRARFGAAGVVPAPERRPQLTLWAPTPPSTSTIEFVFFFPDWVQRVPLCATYDDLIDVLEPLMRFIGLHVSRDPTFLAKLLRLGRNHMATTAPVDPETKTQTTPDPNDPIRLFWYKVLRIYLLPALPLIRGNAVCTVEVWYIMRQFETTLRWQLYGEWKASTYKSHPELCVRQVQTERESKGILRRLSHNTIDTLSGPVAKLAHSNPCIFFTNAVNQIMAYDNLAGVVIQALNFVTIMGFDVLVYIILEALANPHKERVKDDGVNTTDWLQSLASFTGMLFRRYGADLTPLLSYVVHQLHNGQTTEIVVFRELIWKMAGIEPLPSLSDSQIAAMAGGPTLRIEAVASTTRGARLDPSDAVLKGPYRLGKALVESSLALPLLIQVAQQRQSCVFQAQDAHLKSLASLFDTTHGVLLQYLELLNTPTVISPQDYAEKIVPSLAELNEKYGICAPICMQIYRPILNGALLAAALAMQEKERIAMEEAEKRLKAALTAKREPNVTASRVASPNPGAESAANGDVSGEPKVTVSESQSGDVVMESTEDKANTPLESPWLPELAALFDDVKNIAPGNAAEVIGPAFYLTFWQLSTYDLSPPAAKYDEECASLRTLSRQEDSMYISADRSADRARRMTASTHRDKRNRINGIVSELMRELKEQTAARAFTIKRIAREKQHWFAHNPKAGMLAQSIIDNCIQPRCLISPMDADFCAQFIKVLHLQGTPGFSTMQCLNKILGEHIGVVVFSCSEYEAHNYGRFLLGVLTDVQKWYQDEQLFNQENRSKSGGTTILLPGLQMRFSATRGVLTQDDLVSWEAYKQIARKWHKRLGKALEQAIDSGEFMHVYNAIIVLKEILPVFPIAAITGVTGMSLSRTIEKFVEKEERGDLKIIGRAYQASLKKRESLWAVQPPPPPKASTPKPGPTAAERPRTGTPSTSSATSQAPSETRRGNGPPSATPIPKLQASISSNAASPAPPDRNGTPNSMKLALESVPRPEVVKRVRPDPRDEGKAVPKSDAMDVDQNATPSISRDNLAAPTALRPASAIPPSVSDGARGSRPATPNQPRAAATRSIPNSPRGTHGFYDQKTQPVMPPPSEPSQTLSAQELRETAKQSRAAANEKDVQPPTEPRAQAGSTPARSPRRRSISPSSRPGTRNPSQESRASGGRSRGDKPDDKRAERDGRPEPRDSARRENRTERRAAREERDKDVERERERGRDRHGERERRGDREHPRERERDKERDRDRERDREGHRERERERDRDKDRDRHRRDEKDRDRDGRKEREGSGRAPAAVSTDTPPNDRGLPNRPETGRHRGDDSLGKRRRGGEDERASRKDSHHDDRSRRSSDKEGHDRGGRDSDRRRKDREAGDGDGKGLSIDTKLGDKRSDGPPSAKTLPPSTPSAPRAMTSSGGDSSRKGDVRDRDWKRDQPPHAPSGPGPSGGAQNGSSQEPQGGSLRSRIGERDTRALPQTPTAPPGDRKSDGGRDDDRDGSRKRTISDRERDAPDAPGSNEPITQAPKRLRLIRDRYGTAPSNLAKKLLPIDPQAADKARAARKD
ncbi:transcription factor/nuclear export subunit protein 2-domain-containing protein [Daedaleopsis nitida]|nr:transcription factor/nuclear export subunit protein 2-domain-containing protein [Daedaleopsis nitida]